MLDSGLHPQAPSEAAPSPPLQRTVQSTVATWADPESSSASISGLLTGPPPPVHQPEGMDGFCLSLMGACQSQCTAPNRISLQAIWEKLVGLALFIEDFTSLRLEA